MKRAYGTDGSVAGLEERGRRRVTLREVARIAGVSATTVSNVVNGKYGLMAAETRDAVERLVRETGYRPHSSGRSLRLARHTSVGLIVIDASPRFLADPFITQLAAGLSNALNRRGLGLVVNGMAGERVDESVLVRSHDTEALCVIAQGSEAQRRGIYRRLARALQPLVVLQDRPPRGLADTLCLRQDDRAGGCALARRLVERGARRLLLLVPEREWPAMRQRERGAREALARFGAPAELITLPCGDEGIEATQAALTAWCGRHGLPDAVMGGNDRMAIAAMLWAQDRGIAVPASLRVTGFNGFEFGRYVRPALTTARSPSYELGLSAAEAILGRLATGRFGEREIVLPVELVPGGSD